MSRRRVNISAALQKHRAALLSEGRRRFYVHPLDVGHNSSLGKVGRTSLAACISAAHAWMQQMRSDPCWWFRVVERAELPGMSVVASYQDILVYSDRFEFPAVRNDGRTFDQVEQAGAKAPCVARLGRGRADASRVSGTFKATDVMGNSCKRQFVPRIGKAVCDG